MEQSEPRRPDVNQMSCDSQQRGQENLQPQDIDLCSKSFILLGFIFTPNGLLPSMISNTNTKNHVASKQKTSVQIWPKTESQPETHSKIRILMFLIFWASSIFAPRYVHKIMANPRSRPFT